MHIYNYMCYLLTLIYTFDNLLKFYKTRLYKLQNRHG